MSDWSVKRIVAHLFLLLLYFIMADIAYWGLSYTLENRIYQSPYFWVFIIPCLLMGLYYGEFRTYLGKHKRIGWIFALSILALFSLAKTGDFPFLDNSLYLLSFSPFMAMTRFYYLELSERNKRKTIFN
jgi:hypothetical protein